MFCMDSFLSPWGSGGPLTLNPWFNLPFLFQATTKINDTRARVPFYWVNLYGGTLMLTHAIGSKIQLATHSES